ncbi:MAG: hypothetical protein LBS28_03200 [Streptococcaceae bacterium]|jgi:hypothetical protein|nr:hypothetical protein [Streptococcaceae bacterium]
MKTLIIPCLGRSMVDGVPKYLARHPLGTLAVRYAIDSINFNDIDRIIVSILNEDNQKYHARDIVQNELSDLGNVEFILFNKRTNGPAETVYEMIKRADVKGSILIKDVDSRLEVSPTAEGNFLVGWDLSKFETQVHFLRNKSFIVLNEQFQVLDIVEKSFRSNVISVGLYGFCNVEDFIFSYEKLKKDFSGDIVLYISHVISYLIGFCGHVFKQYETSIYEEWGNDKSWQHLQKIYGTYFVNIDNLFLDREKFFWKLSLLSKRGAKIIFLTNNSKEGMIDVIDYLKGLNFNPEGIIFNCNYSNVKKIISSKENVLQLIADLE